MRVALALSLFPFSAFAASLTGAVVDPLGGSISHMRVELNSGTNVYLAQTDDAGLFKFSDLPAGEYTLKFRKPGFKALDLRSIKLSESEQKRIPDVPLDVGICSPIYRELVLLPSDDVFGRLSGTVRPPAPGVEITLICRTFSACRSTKTDSNGKFSFDMLSAGVYGLNFRRDGFYPENATGYAYAVNAGWESVYTSVSLEKCRDGNCDPKRRPQRPPRICE
jgi:carboxypeptidase family protein